MEYNEPLISRVRTLLADLPDVEEKRMFRRLMFRIDGKMCICVGADDVIYRIDPAVYEQAVQQNGCRALQMKGKDCKGYILVEEDMLRSEKEFRYWAGLALEFNERAKAAPKKPKARKVG